MEVCQCDGQQNAEAIVLTEDGMHITAFWSRLLCGCGKSGRFKPIFVMENIIPLVDSTFNYRIIDEAEWRWSVYEKAFYNPTANEIIIRSDVYEGALNGKVIDVITLAHEVVHCIQSIIMRFLNAFNCVEFKTELCKANSDEMAHHELQTDKITSLVLCPEKLMQGKSDDEIVQKYFVNPLFQFICGLIKMSCQELLESLDDMNCIKGKTA
ncbi:MAG: hypothetical protein J6X78_13935 [Treponema sp.]|nr:hypothetical protein [Treponema sp.]